MIFFQEYCPECKSNKVYLTPDEDQDYRCLCCGYWISIFSYEGKMMKRDNRTSAVTNLDENN